MPSVKDYERSISVDVSCKCGSASVPRDGICLDCGGTRGERLGVDPLITLAELQALMKREKFTISKIGGSWRVRCMVVDRSFQSYALPEAYKKFREWRAQREAGL